MFPTPARRRWSMIAFFTAARVPWSRSANTNGVNVSSSGSGPMRLVYAAHPFSSSSQTVPSRRTSRYRKKRPSSRVQVSTAYFVSSFVGRRSYTISEPVMRGCTTSRWPLARRSTACLARRLTCSTAFPVRVRSNRGFETRRNTSLFLSRARTILWPSSRGPISRTIVSTSGSSGTLQLPPSDIPPVGLPLEGDALAQRRAPGRGLRDRVAEPGHAEHAAAVHPQRAVRVAVRARVEHVRVGRWLGWKHDRGAHLGLIGVAPRGEHRAHGRTRGGERRPLGPPPARRDGRERSRERARGQHWEQRLRFGVAEAAIELEHVGRSVGRDHQTGVEHSLVRRPPGRHLAQRGGQHLAAHALDEFFRREAHGAVGAHAARVGPGVALAQALVVLRRRQNLDLLPVREGEDGELLALQKLLDYDLAARVPQPAFGEHGPGGCRRLVPRRTDHGALAAGESRGLDDERHGVAGDVGEGGSGLGDALARRGRHAGGAQYGFGQGLGGGQPRGRLRGPERRPARRAQAIDEARGEGSLGPHDGEVDPVAGDGRRELVHRGGRDLEVAAVPRGARVAGGGAEGRVGEVALQRPAERVLAAAPADDQDPHFFFKASAKAWAARFAVSTTSSTTAFASFM